MQMKREMWAVGTGGGMTVSVRLMSRKVDYVVIFRPTHERPPPDDVMACRSANVCFSSSLMGARRVWSWSCRVRRSNKPHG